MKTRTSILVLFAAALLIMAGCNKSLIRVKGNGNVSEETRSVSGFIKVVNEGSFEVYIIQDSVSEVRIEAESNLISHIRTSVNGSTLTIDAKDNLKSTKPIKLFVRTPDIESVKLSGSGIIDLGDVYSSMMDVELSGSGEIYGSVDADHVIVSINGSGTANMGVLCANIETYVSGSGDLYFTGSGETAHFNISGSGSVRAYEFPLQNCYADISGSGDMFVNVSDLLDVDISGSGSIHYIGTPQISTNISGSGSVISAN